MDKRIERILNLVKELEKNKIPYEWNAYINNIIDEKKIHNTIKQIKNN